MTLATHPLPASYGEARRKLRSELDDFKRRHPELIESEEWQEIEEALGVTMAVMSDMKQRIDEQPPLKDCRRCHKPLQASREAVYEVNGIVQSAFQANETLYRCGNRECVDFGTIEVYQNESGNLVFRFPQIQGQMYSPESVVKDALKQAYQALIVAKFAGDPLYTPGMPQHSLIEAGAFAVGAISEEDLYVAPGTVVSPPAGCTCATHRYDTATGMWLHSDTCPLRPD